jgi:DNA-binding beta-propeller fold protein YncE
VSLGATASFSVVASGTAPLTYQWLKNGVSISGATTSSYTTPATVAADSGSAFTVVVENAVNTPATSNPATLYVSHTLALLAGELGGVGDVNATGAAASFYTPVATATDASGNVYVADQADQLIRKITPGGVLTTLAGTPGVVGSNDGACASATFNTPSGIAVDATGNVYVADTANLTIRKITMPGCTVSTLAGTAGVGGSVNGTGAAASFQLPGGLAVDSTGNVYVADTNNDIIRKITPGGVVTTLAGFHGVAGSTDSPTGSLARFNQPMAVAVDSVTGNLYVADYINSTIRKVTAAGAVTTLAGTAGTFGHNDGTGAAASFNGPQGVALDSTATNLYVADPYNRTIRQVVVSSGVVTTFAGTTGTDAWLDGTGIAAHFAFPASVATDSSNNLFVADTDNNMIRMITTPGAAVTTLAGSIGGRGYADGSGSAAQFSDPHNVAADAAGNIFVADLANNVIRKIAPAGVVTTFVGTAGVTGSADGTGAAAQFNAPFGMVFDSLGNLYVADSNNNTIRMITPAGVVSTFAGTAGVTGSADGTGAAAQFNLPYGLAVDSSDTLYLADYGNGTIRKITTPNAVVTTLAGTPGVTGSVDGTGPAAQFWGPHGLGVNLSTGNIYVADRFNGTIRMITPGGVVTTIAGTPGETDFVDGTGAAAHFDWPASVAVDNATGDLYVTDYLHNAVRRIATGNVVTTVVGTAGSLGTVLGTLPGDLTGPSSILIIPGAGLHLVIADSLENAVLLATLP